MQDDLTQEIVQTKNSFRILFPKVEGYLCASKYGCYAPSLPQRDAPIFHTFNLGII